jgi:hypothetical protein
LFVVPFHGACFADDDVATAETLRAACALSFGATLLQYVVLAVASILEQVREDSSTTSWTGAR